MRLLACLLITVSLSACLGENETVAPDMPTPAQTNGPAWEGTWIDSLPRLNASAATKLVVEDGNNAGIIVLPGPTTIGERTSISGAPPFGNTPTVGFALIPLTGECTAPHPSMWFFSGNGDQFQVIDLGPQELPAGEVLVLGFSEPDWRFELDLQTPDGALVENEIQFKQTNHTSLETHRVPLTLSPTGPQTFETSGSGPIVGLAVISNDRRPAGGTAGASIESDGACASHEGLARDNRGGHAVGVAAWASEWSGTAWYQPTTGPLLADAEGLTLIVDPCFECSA